MVNRAQNSRNLFDDASAAFDAKDFPRAVKLCHTALEDEPNNVKTIALLGHSLMRVGKLNQAQNYFKKANRLKPNDKDILSNMGRLLYRTGHYLEAQRSLAKAVTLAPTDKELKIAFTQSLIGTVFQEFDGAIKNAITIVLSDEKLRHRMIFMPWYSLLLSDPDMSDWEIFRRGDPYAVLTRSFDLSNHIQVLNNDYLCLGLKRCIVNNELLERSLSNLRRIILNGVDETLRINLRPFMCALATQCFFNEYMFFVDESEKPLLEALKRDASSADDYLLLACYEPLFSFDNAEEISDILAGEGNDDLKHLARIQIDEPLREVAIKADIKSFTKIEDDVSQAVKQQYEENPYPRWISISGTNISEDKAQASEGLDILVAGCGTGQQAVTMAINFPRARITAMDLSFSSLAYAKRKSDEMRIENIEFQQGDILKIADMGKKFDLIASGGVLHHMDSPKAGLQALQGVLKPKGAMKIALYSEIAREGIVTIQNWIKEQGYSATADGIRAFRKYVLYEPNDPVIEPLKPLVGMISASETRDTYFNVQEHRFTCLGLKDLLADLELDLLQFPTEMMPVKQRYLQMFPDDVHATNLDNWHAFEQQNPKIFLMMYRMLIANKGDYDAGELPNWARIAGAQF